DFGQGRIYRGDEEMTGGFGFYTSILAKGYWQDSQNVLWEISRSDESTLLARGYWVDLPLSQVWRIRLSEQGLIEWDVELEVYEQVKLEEVQANIMLDQDYRNASGRILEVRSGQSALPKSIAFLLDDPHSMCNRKEVEKATFLNSAPMLQYYGILNADLQPGRYKNYFKGRIRIK
ncbi:hypothetical protein ACFL5X_03325, partial [Candidatus Omnitrophota bacterium]